ncbi:polysaccharide deacetylase family protein [Paenibacillus sp. HN-1]|uniref:polysaccharide deacetylase family protein n=1 Tax=Paenibacillus TaxID=44249 RepID=UPI001CA9BD4B|nr:MULTISPECIES: polysaccharide deacetylase family protein [Paenibacillus]MBY9080894.1 polysaccharide deacetylase family protein [Paenibacillus sp. CGMCC 1.18879]MBY9085114.1 polysaccharide deacetylase family protein [Paenibacillus sinensis]
MNIRKIGIIAIAFTVAAILTVHYGFKRGDQSVDFVMGSRVIPYSGPHDYKGHKLMVPKNVAERLLGVKIGWEPAPVLPKGVYYRDKVAVLMYHHLSTKPILPSILSVNRFAEQMELLKQEGYHVITMEQYRKFMLDGEKVPDNAVLLTFDDGYESFYKLAYPILRQYGYTAVNFVIVSDVDNPGKGGLPKLTWTQMREMKKAGMSFYNHTYNLHYYDVIDADGDKRPALAAQLYINDENRNETNEEYYRRVEGDLGRAELRLKQELGNTDSALAFPYGANNDRVLQAASSVGIPLTFTVKEGLAQRGDLNADRINAGSNLRTPLQTIGRILRFVPKHELLVNGQDAPNQVAPEYKQGNLLVPLDDICQSLHIAMDYDRSSGTVRLTPSLQAGGRAGSAVAASKAGHV